MKDSALSFCREITTDQEMTDLREPWSELLVRCSYPTPFCSWEWAWEWWQHFGKNTSPGFRIIVAQVRHSDGQLIGLAPFFVPVARALTLHALRPFAARSHCSVYDLTEEPVILLDRDHEAEALRGVCLALLGWEGRRDLDLIHLRAMRLSSAPDLRSFWRPLARRTPFLLTRPRRHVGQTRALPGDWQALRRTLSKSMRDNIAYYPRLLTREGHAWRVRLARAPEEVAAAVPILIDLHHRRALSERGPSHADHLPLPVHQQFLRDVLTLLAGQGLAAVALLEVDGVPVAAQSVLECQGMLTFYYSGFDPHWYRYSPVTILHVEILQDAILRGLTRVDYLPDIEPWKTRWGTEPEYVYEELTCLSVHPRALLRQGWRKIMRRISARRGAPCECGFCTEEEKGAAAQKRAPEEVSVTSGQPSPNSALAGLFSLGYATLKATFDGA